MIAFTVAGSNHLDEVRQFGFGLCLALIILSQQLCQRLTLPQMLVKIVTFLGQAIQVGLAEKGLCMTGKDTSTQDMVWK